MEKVGIVGDRVVDLPVPSMRTSRPLRLRFYLAMGACDALAIFVGFYVAALIRFGSGGNPEALALAASVLPLFWLLCGQGYSAEALSNWRAGFMPALGGLLLATLLMMFLGFAIKASDDVSRVLLSVGVVASACFIGLGRALLGRLARRSFDGQPMANLFIADAHPMDCPFGHHPACAQALRLDPTDSSPAFLDRLAQVLAGADGVLVACPPERRRAWAMALKGSNVRAALVIPELDSIGGVGVMHVGGVATMLVSTGPLPPRDRIMKRMLDLVLSIPAILFLMPLMLFTALAIRLDSSGPVFFAQNRVGRGNRLFRMFKFRSMRTELADCDGRTSAARDDPRVTRVGRFIRATSIDELPQLINILRGEMSFVGPRPHALGSLAGDQLFWEVDARYWHRHACKPGLTGLAQVRGFRGATHRREDLVNRLQADLEYVNGWSLSRDLSILLSTVKVIVHRNAF